MYIFICMYIYLPHDVQLHIAGTDEPKSAQQIKQDEHNIHVIMKTICSLLRLLRALWFIDHWYQQCVIVHHVTKCMSCYKVIMVIYIYLYIIYITKL